MNCAEEITAKKKKPEKATKKNRQITVRLPSPVFEKLYRLSVRKNRSMNSIIYEAIKKHLRIK